MSVCDQSTSSWRRTVATEQYWSGDGLVVCFDQLTGDTHVINEFSANLLNTLSKKWISTTDLCSTIPDLSVPEEEKQDFLDHVNNILLDLCEYGLVEQG